MSTPSTHAEARRLRTLYNDDLPRILDCLERQLNALYMRAQILMTLAGMVVTVTGFSGRLVAGTNLFAQWAIIAGLFIVLCSVVWVLSRVMALRWMTTGLTDDPEESLVRILERRNRKTQAFVIGAWIMGVGLFVYGIAVSIMLLNPVPLDIAVR